MEPKIPSDKEIALLYRRYHTPPHVQAHCRVVAELATELGMKFIAKGVNINVPLLRSSALLHDFVRVVDFKTFEPHTFPTKPTDEDVRVWQELREKYRGMHHADAAYDLLFKQYPAVADLILKHKFLQIEKGFETWEEKILFYSDKRVKHDQIAPLASRLEDGRRRNAPETFDTEKAAELDRKVFELEREIFTKIG